MEHPTMEGPGPEDWIPVMLGFARDRSEAGWVFTRPDDVREAMAERQVLAAVGTEPRPVEGVILARIVAHPGGRVAILPDPAGEPVAGPPVPELVAELAHAMKAVVVVDGEVAIGPAGVPLEEVPADVMRAADDSRTVYAWRGTEALVARAAAAGLQETVTRHAVDGWTVLATGPSPQRMLTGLPNGGGHPYVVLTRRGPERHLEYVGGSRPEDLHLSAWWGPHLEPVPEPVEVHEETRDLLEAMAHPRFGFDHVPEHEDLTPEHRSALREALAEADGARFYDRMTAALGLREVAGQLAEQGTDAPEPLLGGEVVESSSRKAIVRAAFKEALATPEKASPLMLWAGVLEVAVGLVSLSSVWLGFLPGPTWLWAVLGSLILLDGLHTLVWQPLVRRRSRRDVGGTGPGAPETD